jgi:hypothetical protein
MPKSRRPKLFSKFRNKKKNQEESLAHAIGVDETFDARTVGAKRGSWESFKPTNINASAFDNEDEEWDDEWSGGAFSLKSKVEHRGREVEDKHKRVSHGYLNPFEGIKLSGEYTKEADSIVELDDGFINTEVWFVALGASYADNAGIKEFIDKNKEELRGAMFVELTGLGAGDTAIVSSQGRIHEKKPSSRLKRYVNKAASNLGIRVGSIDLRWSDSASFVAQECGFQSLHLVGAKDGIPAYFGQIDDTMDVVDDQKITINTNIVMELIRAF